MDEDEKSLPHICDDMRDLGHEVLQVADWKDLKEVITHFKPDGIFLDLMIPKIGLNDSGSSYTTGAFIYKNIIHNLCPGIPFVIFSAAPLKISLIREAAEELSKYNEFRGIFSKGRELNYVIEHLK
ncbi:MAG: hypothetical protein QM796_18430 [Chthoniobacteraceae bacterium]